PPRTTRHNRTPTLQNLSRRRYATTIQTVQHEIAAALGQRTAEAPAAASAGKTTTVRTNGNLLPR
ncbi:MAG: hypothetical protein KDA89_22170, partial [Planctomycetaceae bacterium]|nr:hypothetical protein [Planctomycetaceae bacterium]